jgi:hypothetical protein
MANQLLHCHILVRGMGAGKAADAPHLPALGTMLGHARRIEQQAEDADSWLCRFFGVERQHDWPVAPYSCLGDGIDPDGTYWLRADPVHLHLQRDHFTLVDSSRFDLTLDEAQQYVVALNAHFAADGIRFFAPCASRWYLQLQEAPGITTHALADVIGQDMHAMMPQGSQATKWNSVLNEAQMLLHAHPANQQREDRGDLPVNSFWLWGGGMLRQRPTPDAASIWADDALTRGLSLAGGRTAKPVPASCRGWLEQVLATEEGEHLIVLDAPELADLRGDFVGWGEELVHLEQHWFSPLLQALKDGQVTGVCLHFAEVQRVASFRLARGDLWKFWRRTKSLQQALPES